MSDRVTAQEVCEVLRLQLADALYCPPDEIGDDLNFGELGLDSVLSAELSAVINAHFGLDERAIIFSQHPTLAQLTAYITGRANELQDAN